MPHGLSLPTGGVCGDPSFVAERAEAVRTWWCGCVPAGEAAEMRAPVKGGPLR